MNKEKFYQQIDNEVWPKIAQMHDDSVIMLLAADDRLRVCHRIKAGKTDNLYSSFYEGMVYMFEAAKSSLLIFMNPMKKSKTNEPQDNSK